MKSENEQRTYLRPPKPTEEMLGSRVTRQLDFPNGHSMTVTMSEWHWALADFLNLWRIDRGYEHSIYFEWYKKETNCTDRSYSDSVMLGLRDLYNNWLEKLDPGVEPRFLPPKNPA